MRSFGDLMSAMTFAAPWTRPAGLDPAQAYEPTIEGRYKALDWVSMRSIALFYAIPGSDRIAQLAEAGGDAEHAARLLGVAGAPVAMPAGATRIAVIGDFGDGSEDQRAIALALAKWHPDIVATVGDNVYPLGRERDWAAHFDAIYGASLPTPIWRPALGNHDYYSGDLTPYFRRFPQLHGRAYYTWRSGDAEFFVLDSEQRLGVGSAQRAWLRRALARSTARFKVVQLHRPVYSSLESGFARDARASLGPLFAHAGVQLVLTGHEHGYERSQAIDGVTYIVTGGAGAPVLENPFALARHTRVRSSVHHWLQLAVTGTQMLVDVVDEQGRTIDGFAIDARARQGS